MSEMKFDEKVAAEQSNIKCLMYAIDRLNEEIDQLKSQLGAKDAEIKRLGEIIGNIHCVTQNSVGRDVADVAESVHRLCMQAFEDTRAVGGES